MVSFSFFFKSEFGDYRWQIHGVLNAASWGFLFPVGIMIARYLRTFKCADPAWFYLHVGCQLPAYAIGAAGLATGLLQLGSKSKGTQYTWHRYLGIALLSLATLQVLTLHLSSHINLDCYNILLIFNPYGTSDVADFWIIPKTEQGCQVPILLEHIPSWCWIFYTHRVHH